MRFEILLSNKVIILNPPLIPFLIINTNQELYFETQRVEKVIENG
jgi:hypothetical protein